MKIGILQCGQSPDMLRDEMGDYPDMFTRLLSGKGFDFQTWHVEGSQFPDSVHDADGWLITGARHGVYEPHDWIPPLEDFLREAYAESAPMVGICFGHQLIAQALGGKVEKFDRGWSVGVRDYDFEGRKVTLNAWHQDQVTKRPEEARVIGCNDFCENAALIYPGHAYTVQAHPEFRHEFVQGLIDTRARGVVPDPVLEQALARMGEDLDSDYIAEQIAAFFRNPNMAA